jgi:hypothetical protein
MLLTYQELKAEIYTIRNEIKQIVVEAKKNAPAKAPEPEPAKEAPQPNQEQKMVKFRKLNRILWRGFSLWEIERLNR